MTWCFPNGLATEPRLGSNPFYGPRAPIVTPGGTTGAFHTGIDYVGFVTVRAVGPGRVIYASRNADYGNEVRVDHGGWVSRYCHLADRSTRVKVGALVVGGTPLGVMSATGKAKGVHLHLRFDRNGVHFNPRPFLYTLVRNQGGSGGGGTPIDNRRQLMGINFWGKSTNSQDFFLDDGPWREYCPTTNWDGSPHPVHHTNPLGVPRERVTYEDIVAIKEGLGLEPQLLDSAYINAGFNRHAAREAYEKNLSKP